jgi:predicted small lipoprotein YifL
MKKIIALVLVIGCMLSLASCGLFGNNTPEQPDDSHAIPDIQAKIDASAPKGADITVTFTTALGVLNGTYKAVYNEDGTATVDYSYEKFNTIGASENNELKSTVTGTATVAADGSVTGDLTNDGLTAVSFDLNLDEAKLSSVAINAGVLSANVKAADTAAILGVALDSDAQLSVVTGTNGITSMTVAYTTASGEVEIVTVYN